MASIPLGQATHTHTHTYTDIEHDTGTHLAGDGVVAAGRRLHTVVQCVHHYETNNGAHHGNQASLRYLDPLVPM